MDETAGPTMLRSDQVGLVDGLVVVIDVIRAFTTAACALSVGAEAVYLVAGVDEALAFTASHPGSVAMGEDRGLRPEGFDLPNSPVRALEADLDGRTVVQRTSAGTQGVVAARSAERLWCSSLVCASATARALITAAHERPTNLADPVDVADPTYVITGWFTDRPDRPGTDDRITARFVDDRRRALLGLGPEPDPIVASRGVLRSDEAERTLALGAEHVDPRDIEVAVDVDRFDFAMEVCRDDDGLRLARVDPARSEPT